MPAIENAIRWSHAIKTMQHKIALQHTKCTSTSAHWICPDADADAVAYAGAGAYASKYLLAVQIIVYCVRSFLVFFHWQFYFSHVSSCCISNCHCRAARLNNNVAQMTVMPPPRENNMKLQSASE